MKTRTSNHKIYEKELDKVLSMVLKKHFNSFELYNNNLLLSKICEQMIYEIYKNPKLSFEKAAEKSIKKVKNSIRYDIKSLFSSINKKQLNEMFGKDLVKKVLK